MPTYRAIGTSDESPALTAAPAPRHGDWTLPQWARWNSARRQRYTVGVEEEVMLLDPSNCSLAQSSDWALARLSDELAAHVSPETHASVIELTTGVHPNAAGAAAELAALRRKLASELRDMGLGVAAAGSHPLALPGETQVSRSQRYRSIAGSMRSLAFREPTMALHVHIGVPDPEDAIRLLNGLREVIPLLLALSANSPFCQGRDSGFASARTVIFQGFPRTGTARRFVDYRDYVGAVDALIASGAIPDPSFLWWDIRPQPSLGTVELRVMDAQTTIADNAALIALVQALARLELEDEATTGGVAPEVLAENRFLAARDGLDARLIDPVARRLIPARGLVDGLLRRGREHIDSVGLVELERIGRLLVTNGADRQRAWSREGGLASVLSRLVERFGASPERDEVTALEPPGVTYAPTG